MNTHSYHFPFPRALAAIFAVCAVSMLMAAKASAGTPSDLAISSTAPTGVTYGDKVAYTVTTTSSGSGAITLSIDSGSSSVCKLTGGVVSVTGAGTCKITADQVADVTYDAGSVSQSFSVAKAALTVTAASSQNFYGGSVPSIAAFYSGFVNGDSSSKLKTKPSCSTTAIPISNPGTYPTSCKSAASDNYSFKYVDGSYVVTQAPLVLVPSAKIKLGKGLKSVKLNGYGWEGWDDDDTNDLYGKPKCKVPAAAKRKPGTYKLTCSVGTLKSLNYAFTLAPGLLVVKK